MKNELLSKIEMKIKLQQDDTSHFVCKLKDDALDIFNECMETDESKAILSQWENALDASRELTEVTYDEFFHRWTRVDFSKLIDIDNQLQRDLLEEYLSTEYIFHADFKNQCLTTSEGPCILINESGDVLDQDSGKWIISQDQYETVEERDAAIESWMDRTGYFPSVIYSDRYGNAGYVRLTSVGAV